MSDIQEHEFECYNDRRYGKPWGAKAKLDGVKLVLDFKSGAGSYAGDSSGGSVFVKAKPGAVYAVGQKDYRKPRNTYTQYYRVQTDGNREAITRADATKHLMSNGG